MQALQRVTYSAHVERFRGSLRQRGFAQEAAASEPTGTDLPLGKSSPKPASLPAALWGQEQCQQIPRNAGLEGVAVL